MSSLPDTAVCLHCGYSLRGLPENRCPECGGEFVPDNPKTWWDSSRVGLATRTWHALAAPPSRWHLRYAILLTGSYLLVLIQPPWTLDRDGEYVVAINYSIAVFPLVVIYIIKLLVRCIGLLVEFGQQVPNKPKVAGRWRWGVLPLCLLTVFAAIWWPGWAFRVSFAVSRPFLEWKADQVARAGVADNQPGVVGLYWVHRVGLVGGTEAKFEVGGGWFGVGGSWWIIIRDHKGRTRDQFVPGYRHYWRHIVGDWYLHRD